MRRSGIRYTVGMATSVTGFLDVKVDGGLSYKESDRLPNRSGELYPSASDRIFLTQAYYDRCRLLGYLTGSGSDYAYVCDNYRYLYKSCSAEDLGAVTHDASGHGYSRAVPGPPFGGPPTVVTPLFTDADTTLFMSIVGLYYSNGLPSFVEDGFSIRSGLGGSEAEYDPSTSEWSGDAVQEWAWALTDDGALKSVFTGNRLCELSDAPHGSDPEGGGSADYAHCPTFGYTSVSSGPAPCLDNFVFRRSRVTEAYENLSRLNRAVVRLAVIGNTQAVFYSVKNGSTTTSASGTRALVTRGSSVEVSVYPSVMRYGVDASTVSSGLLSKPVGILIIAVTNTSAQVNYKYKYKTSSEAKNYRTVTLYTEGKKASVVAYRPNMSSFGRLSVGMNDLGLSTPKDHEDFPLVTAFVADKMSNYSNIGYADFEWEWGKPELTNVAVNASAGEAYAVVEFNSSCHTNVNAQDNLK